MVPRTVADASILHLDQNTQAHGGGVRSCVNKRVRLILVTTVSSGLNEDVGVGLVDNLYQIAVGVLKVSAQCR